VTPKSKSAPAAWAAFTGPAGAQAVALPGAFAVLALMLLVYDHLQDRIPPLVFWLCVLLIACVFAWLVGTARRQSQRLVVEQERAIRDGVTGLPNREALLDDLPRLSGPERRHSLIVVELEGLQTYCDAGSSPNWPAGSSMPSGRSAAPCTGSTVSASPSSSLPRATSTASSSSRGRVPPRGKG
jgi:hypothetical protein